MLLATGLRPPTARSTSGTTWASATPSWPASLTPPWAKSGRPPPCPRRRPAPGAECRGVGAALDGVAARADHERLLPFEAGGERHDRRPSFCGAGPPCRGARHGSSRRPGRSSTLTSPTSPPSPRGWSPAGRKLLLQSAASRRAWSRSSCSAVNFLDLIDPARRPSAPGAAALVLCSHAWLEQVRRQNFRRMPLAGLADQDRRPMSPSGERGCRRTSSLQPPMSTTRPGCRTSRRRSRRRRAWSMSITCHMTGRFSRTWRLIVALICSNWSREGARIVEVEAGDVRRDQRALLLGAFAQDVLERPVQDVGDGVVAHRLPRS